MLTRIPAEKSSASWSAAHVAAAALLSIITFTSAYAGSVSDWSCVGGWRGFNCVEQSGSAGDPYIRLVPEPVDQAEKERFQAHDRKWLARCRPVIEHDHYGVAHYHYSAPGCEFGLGAD